MQEMNAQEVQANIPNTSAVSLLVRGGQKTVFCGVHEDYGKVVIKVMPESDSDERLRLEREAEVATVCRIPNTARLYASGAFEHAGGCAVYIVEEFIEGVTLRDELKAKQRLCTPTVLKLLRVLLEAAVAMEEQEIVHRDIKPENIMVCSDGSFMLLDFGIARHLAKTSITPTEAHFGPHTAGYAAPEQFRNLKKEIDIRTDLFAIGVVTYECLLGVHPFADGAIDQLDILRRTEKMIISAPEIPEDPENQLGGFIVVLMDRYPSRRPPSATMAKQWFESICAAMNLGES